MTHSVTLAESYLAVAHIISHLEAHGIGHAMCYIWGAGALPPPRGSRQMEGNSMEAIMSARNDTIALQHAIESRLDIEIDGINFDDANTLRRAQIVLHRWAKHECGDGNDYASWAIERDETTGIPYMCRYPHTGKMSRTRIADREAGALRRVKAICERLGLHYYHQGDPRGCALYIATEELTDTNYTRGVACCA